MTPLERAMQRVELYLETLEPSSHLPDDVSALIASREARAMELVAEVASASPEHISVETLWTMTADTGVEVTTRVEAVRIITRVLLNVWEDFELDLPFDDEEPLMSEADFEGHVARLVGTYRAADYPDELRRRALECAANVTSDPAVQAAGHAAFRSEDPEWVATGVLVIALTDADRSAAVVDEALQHSDEEVRITAIHAVGLSDDDEAVARLTQLAEERLGDERSAALQALVGVSRSGAGEALAFLAETLEGDAQLEADEALEAWVEEWAGVDEEDFDEIGDWDEAETPLFELESGDDPDEVDPDDDGGLNGTSQH